MPPSATRQPGTLRAALLAGGVLWWTSPVALATPFELALSPAGRTALWGIVAAILALAWLLARRLAQHVTALQRQVVELTARLREMTAIAHLDTLTGLLNHAGFADAAGAEIRRVFRAAEGFSLVLLEVDNLPAWEDRYGRACGERLVQFAADTLRARVRQVDQLAHLGAGEFALLLPETDLDGASLLAERLRLSFSSKPFEGEGEGEPADVTMTFGVASYQRGEELDSCLARAEAALCEGRARGCNRVMIGAYRGLTLVN
jgi:diguanylate cyclase (GGDEF)-like protein